MKERLSGLATAFVAVLAVSAISAEPVRGSILTGCVGTNATGVSDAIGWVDVGVMLTAADPEPPASLHVVAPDGSEVEYRDGAGLTPPTETMPIWFAPALMSGEYRLVINGSEACTAFIGAEENASISIEQLVIDWEARSAPIRDR
jgi:hypothetical protein